MRILKDFKSNEFGSADSKRVMGAFCGSADSKGLSFLGLVNRRRWGRRSLQVDESIGRSLRASIRAAKGGVLWKAALQNT